MASPSRQRGFDDSTAVDAPDPPRWQSAVLPFAAVALTTASYLVWLGWHQLEDQSAYEPWQVVGLALTLAVFVIAATWRSMPIGLLTAAVVTITLTVVWSWDAATTPTQDANLWPIGAAFLLFGAAIGLTLTSVVTLLVRQARGYLARRRSGTRRRA